MKMIGHHDEFMEEVCVLVTVVQESLYKNLRYFGDLENDALLMTLRRNKVRTAWSRSVSGCRHEKAFFLGLKPEIRLPPARGLEPPPPKEKNNILN